MANALSVFSRAVRYNPEADGGKFYGDADRFRADVEELLDALEEVEAAAEDGGEDR